MEVIYPWLRDLNKIEGIADEWVGLICLLASVFCGAFVGIERERREKPAGLRTVMLITVGSTIFTLVSLMLAKSKPTADPARLASQIVPGIGFLGAGAIIYARGHVVGLTTGATIWACAAVGVTIGSGHVAAGFVFTAVIFLTLTVLQRAEVILGGRCERLRFTVRYRSDRGKAWVRLQHVLDRYNIDDVAVRQGEVTEEATGEERVVEINICTAHRSHRAVLKDIVDDADVVAIECEPALCRAS
jgi:putative Mg2+ transporter-C (MgtC) family protein